MGLSQSNWRAKNGNGFSKKLMIHIKPSPASPAPRSSGEQRPFVRNLLSWSRPKLRAPGYFSRRPAFCRLRPCLEGDGGRQRPLFGPHHASRPDLRRGDLPRSQSVREPPTLGIAPQVQREASEVLRRSPRFSSVRDFRGWRRSRDFLRPTQVVSHMIKWSEEPTSDNWGRSDPQLSELPFVPSPTNDQMKILRYIL